MFKRFIFLIVVLVFMLSGNAPAQIDPASVTDGNIYLFDNVSGGQVPDDSANSNTGTVVGTPIVVPGLRGNALQFNGTSDGVNIPDSAYINITNGPFDNRTIMAVFKCDDVTKQEKQTIVDEGGRTRGLVIYVFDGQVYVGGWNRAEYDWNPGSWISAPINSNQWYTVALIIRDGHEAVEDNKFEMWLDGELVGKAPGGHIHNHSNNNAIGYTQEYTVFHDNDGNGDGWYFDGAIDEVWFLNQALTEKQLRAFVGKLWPYASDPTPADGVIVESTWANLGWTAGDLAVSHDVYFGTSFDDVNDGAEGTFVGNIGSPFQVVGFTGFPAPDGLEPGTTYYWRVDEINNDDPGSPYKGEVWSFLVPSLTAYNPGPPDGMRFVDETTTLNWSNGYEAKLHSVYLGEDAAEVAAGTGDTFKGQFGVTTFTPGTLDFDKTYYWRVDEFDGANTYQGDVWSFKTVPEIPVNEDPNLIAWWKIDEGIGKRALDWSGHGNNVIFFDPIWTEPGKYGNTAVNLNGRYGSIQNLKYSASNLTQVTVCAWVRTSSGSDQYIVSFDRNEYYRLEINGDGGGTGQIGWDVMTSSGQFDNGSITRVDDGQWHHVAGVFDNGFMVIYIDGVPEPSASGGQTFGTGNTRFGFIGANSEATSFDGSRGGGSPVTGEVDDIRIYDRALTQADLALVMRGDLRLAWTPSPANGSTTGINVASTLSWSPGDGASQHDVYFGADQTAVLNADASDTTGVYKGRQNSASYTPEDVAMDSGPYYWRVDEVMNDATIVKGGIWSFSVADYVLVEDFDAYNDIEDGQPGSNLVYLTWLDGFDNPSTNGSTMGYTVPFQPTMETANAHGGSGKSAPMMYNNATAPVSEVTRSFTPAQNWTDHGAQTLSLWFFGDVNNVPGQLYIKVNGVRVNYDGEAANLRIPIWQPWNIDLASLGVNLQSVTSMAIGIEGSFATGTLLLDDIKLYPYPEEFVTPVQPDPAGLVAQYEFEGTVNDSVGGHNGTANGGPLYGLGKSGQAITLDGIDDYVVVGSVGISGAEPRTIAGWAKANALGTPAWVDVFGFTGPSGNNGHFDIELVGTAAAGGTTLGWYGLHVYGWQKNIIPIDLEWHHLAASYDGTTTKWYGDGMLVGSDDQQVLNTPDNVHIGKREDNTNYFPGQVDDFRIYNRVLTDGEVAGLAGKTQPFDKGF